MGSIANPSIVASNTTAPRAWSFVTSSVAVDATPGVISPEILSAVKRMAESGAWKRTVAVAELVESPLAVVI